MAFFRHDFRPKRERTNRFSKKTWIWHTWFALAGHKKKMHLAPREALSLTRALNRRKTLPLKSKIHMIKYWYDLLTLAFMRRETELGEENEVATLWGEKKKWRQKWERKSVSCGKGEDERKRSAKEDEDASLRSVHYSAAMNHGMAHGGGGAADIRRVGLHSESFARLLRRDFF